MFNLTELKKQQPWIAPLLADICEAREVFWPNPDAGLPGDDALGEGSADALIEDAARRLQRFAPWIARAYPETQAAGGLICPCHQKSSSILTAAI